MPGSGQDTRGRDAGGSRRAHRLSLTATDCTRWVPTERTNTRHCFNLVDIGGGPSWAHSPYQWAACVASGHAAGHQAHEVEGPRLGLQPPRQAGPGLEATKPALQPIGGGGHLGVLLAADQLVPAFHEVPQQLAHLGRRRTRPCITASQSANRTGPASGGRSRARRCRMGNRTRSKWVRSSSSMLRMCRPTVRCMCTAHCCRSRPGLQGRAVDRVVSVDALHARGQAREPVRSRDRSDAGPRSPLGPRTTARLTPPMDSQVSSTSTQSFACGSGARPGGPDPATAWRPPRGPAGQPHHRTVGQGTPQTDTVHVQVGHQLPEGLRPLAGGHVGRQGRGAAQTGLALPALDAQAAEDDQVAGIGANRCAARRAPQWGRDTPERRGQLLG